MERIQASDTKLGVKKHEDLDISFYRYISMHAIM
jgi:hypothetical protein